MNTLVGVAAAFISFECRTKEHWITFEVEVWTLPEKRSQAGEDREEKDSVVWFREGRTEKLSLTLSIKYGS